MSTQLTPDLLNNPLLALMHDTAHDLAKLDSAIFLLDRRVNDLKINDMVLYTQLEYMKSARQNLTKRLDDYYIKMKNP